MQRLAVKEAGPLREWAFDGKQIALRQEAQKRVWARREKLNRGFDLKGSMSLGPQVTEQAHFVD